jgi:hypothetical protein
LIQIIRCENHSGKTLAHHAGEGKSMMVGILRPAVSAALRVIISAPPQ